MFVDWWMLFVLAVLTGAWSELRNFQGRRSGYVNGVTDGANTALSILIKDNVVTVKDGKIVPYKEEKSYVRRKTNKQ